MSKPQIVTLLGSSRFVEVFAIVAWWIERDEGKIVHSLHLLPGWYSADVPEHHLAEAEGVAEQMDALHVAKIDLSDEVFVINVGGYIGDSTRKEIQHAEERGRTIRWLEPDKVPDEFKHLGVNTDTTYRDRLEGQVQGGQPKTFIPVD